MVAVYLLVVNYTLSHVHAASDNNQPEISWQKQVVPDADDYSDNRNTGNHHTSGCMLVSQASSPIHFFKIKVPFGAIHNDSPYLLSFDSPTPTKRRTRAPPVNQA